MTRVPDNVKKWAEDAIGYIDLVTKENPENPNIPLDQLHRRYLTNARLLLQKITGAAP